jgi:cytochrome c oxidase subunit 3
MATVTAATTTERVIEKRTGFPVGRGSGNGRNGRGPGGGGGDRHDRHDNDDSSAEKYRIGIWVVLAGVTMMFTALTSAYIVRSVSIDGSRDWKPIAMPRMVLVSTALIILSSITFSIARRALRKGQSEQYRNWLSVTGLLGIAFLIGQYLTWRHLVAEGIYLSSNPHSSFFYLLTATHAIHLMFGLLAIGVLIVKAWRVSPNDSAQISRRTVGTHAVSIYWHFMDGLWIYLFLLLFVWR